MGRLVVCPLSRLAETLEANGAGAVVTLLRHGDIMLPPFGARPHLWLDINDIADAQDGLVHPAATHIDQLFAFAQGWDRSAPLLIHCHAGVGRSTAAAYAVACALQPSRAEDDIARELRRRSPTATPNPGLVALADAALARSDRMVRAIEAIGRGRECFEGEAFELPLTGPDAPS